MPAIIEQVSKQAQPDWPARMTTAQRETLLGVNVPNGVECVWSEEPQWIYLARIRVPHEHRNNGLASDLVDQLKRLARRMGKRGIRLSFQPDEGCEERVRHFYKKRGFHFLSDNETMVWTT